MLRTLCPGGSVSVGPASNMMTRVSGANMILSPPLVISAQEVDFLCTTLEAAFDAVSE